MAPPSVFTLLLGVSMELLQRAPSTMFSGPDADPATVFMVIAGAVVAFIVMVVGYWIAYMVTLGATTEAVSELYVGRTTTIAAAYQRIRGRIGRLLLVALLIGLRLFGLGVGGTFVIFLIVVAIGILTAVAAPAFAALAGVLAVLAFFALALGIGIFALRYCVAIPAVVLENVTAGDAIRRSVFLTKGSRVRAGLLVLFAMVITYAAMAIFQGPFVVGAIAAGPESTTGFWLNLTGAVTGTIGGAITGPLMIIALALLYYDIRIRKEGLDLQLMLASLDSEPAGVQA